ncbi:MAG: ribosome maturation factor RimM, partial [Spirochaetaceae bacterium]|nr:ribosome maturation factor RimM [Spirochaetaceae bacterium]
MIGRFVLGHLGAPFGLRGHIKFRPWSGDTGRILALKQVTLRRSGEERPYTLEEAAGAGAELRLKFRGIDSPEAARALSGAEVLISREEAGEPQPGEYYVEDLRNLEVVALPQGGEAGLDDPAL